MKESISTNSTLAVQSEQPIPVQEVEQNGPTATFFAIGVVINIVLVITYGIWAYKQWKKSGAG